jgi:AraC-like DNA-binding protein
MKAELEWTHIASSNRSFQTFKIEKPRLEPFWHYHPELELTLILKGKGTRFVGNSILPFEPNDLVLVGENLPHQWVSGDARKQQGSKAIVIQFRKEVFNSIPECRDLINLFNDARQGIYFSNPANDMVEKINTFSDHSPAAQTALLIDILDQLSNFSNQHQLSTLAFSSSISAQKQQNKLADTIKFILENLDRKLTVEEMANYTSMLPQSFCRWFKRSVGNSFITFLNKARVEKACQHIVQTDWTIAETSYACGFECVSHFNRVFKSIKHTTPNEYRKGLVREVLKSSSP